MKYSPRGSNRLRLVGAIALTSATSGLIAQESTDVNCDINPSAAECANVLEEVIVTGSRLKRDTFTSIAPLQVITAQISREAGLIDPSSILQESTAATGQQIDLTFGGFVLDNGPGASTVSLRGLGESRTLVLIDGRRIAPAGVEGAPIAADLNLIPGSLIDQYNILLDGASAVYGSDAVAGVANILLRRDFEGLELELFTSDYQQGGDSDYTINATWGQNWDRGFVGFGLEYDKSAAVTLADRDATADCERDYEIDENGQIRTQALFYSEILGQQDRGCQVGLLTSRVSIPVLGSVYYEPGTGNVLQNFSESNLFNFVGIDGDGDGVTDVNFQDHSLNGRTQDAHLFPELDSYKVMGYGEYTFDGEMNLTPFFEALVSRREAFIDSGVGQLFPTVPANNPYNPCNPAGINGVDCGLAAAALFNNPNVMNAFFNTFGVTYAQAGVTIPTATGPRSVIPIVSVRGDRNTTDVEVQQARFVTGLKGDLPQLSFGSLNNWTFETYYSYSTSSGDSSRRGIRGDLLNYSLSTSVLDPVTGNVTCGNGSDGCVPINLFADSLYSTVIGDFATQAERDYLFDSRDFHTEYKQAVFATFLTGDVFEMPAGTVVAGVGFEYRHDKIVSDPDPVARDGLFFGFFSDGGAVGDKYTREIYGEIEFPLLAGLPAAEELTLNLSARGTKDQLYDSTSTYSAKVGWRPVNPLLLRVTQGTSYRAPNLRENFLLSQTGFLNVFDPCVIPDAARDPATGNYIPSQDNREPEILANCLANGVDPTMLDNNGFATYSVEIASGGERGLNEEESDSFSAGFAFEQPWFEAFDLNIGATYYEIEIDNTIIEPNAAFLVNDCYGSLTGNSPFCSRIERDGNGFLDFISASFLNRDNLTVRGIDVNINYNQDVTFFGRPLEIGFDLIMNQNKEQSELFTNDDGSIEQDDDVGEFGLPKWNGQLNLYAVMGDFRFRWTTRYIGSVDQDPLGVDAFDDIFGNSDTCLGPPTDVQCRDVGFADHYRTHTASLYYYGDTWTVGFGIRNVFDEDPPQVDGTEILSINNTPIGYGYDLNGRTFFLNVAANLGGLSN